MVTHLDYLAHRVAGWFVLHAGWFVLHAYHRHGLDIELDVLSTGGTRSIARRLPKTEYLLTNMWGRACG